MSELNILNGFNANADALGGIQGHFIGIDVPVRKRLGLGWDMCAPGVLIIVFVYFLISEQVSGYSTKDPRVYSRPRWSDRTVHLR